VQLFGGTWGSFAEIRGSSAQILGAFAEMLGFLAGARYSKSHVTHMNESGDTDEWNMARRWMSHGKHMNES